MPKVAAKSPTKAKAKPAVVAKTAAKSSKPAVEKKSGLRAALAGLAKAVTAAVATPAAAEKAMAPVEKTQEKSAAPKKTAAPKAKKPVTVVEAKSEEPPVEAAAPEKKAPEAKAKPEKKVRTAIKVVKETEPSKSWAEYKEKHGATKAAAYSMSGTFAPQSALQHKVLGWGWILDVQNDRLSVIFEQGTKILISNYRG